MPVINFSEFMQAAASDPEFVRAMRYFNGSISLLVGQEEQHALHFAEGIMQQAAPPNSATIEVSGTAEQWQRLLEERPRPFFQCLQSAAVKHGMGLAGGDAVFAYLPALNRMVQLMRSLQRGH
jgi:hypothetical protein